MQNDFYRGICLIGTCTVHVYVLWWTNEYSNKHLLIVVIHILADYSFRALSRVCCVHFNSVCT